MTRLRWIVLGVSVFMISFGALLIATIGRSPGDGHGSMLDKPLPALTMQDVAGHKAVTTAGLQGRVVIVNFWNSWCIPCRNEQPALSAFYARHRNDRDFTLLGVVRDDTEARVRSYVARENIDWDIVSDPGSRAAVAFGTTGQPETYAIAANGVVVGQQFGPTTVSDLEKMLAAARGAS